MKVTSNLDSVKVVEFYKLLLQNGEHIELVDYYHLYY